MLTKLRYQCYIVGCNVTREKKGDLGPHFKHHAHPGETWDITKVGPRVQVQIDHVNGPAIRGSAVGGSAPSLPAQQSLPALAAGVTTQSPSTATVATTQATNTPVATTPTANTPVATAQAANDALSAAPTNDNRFQARKAKFKTILEARFANEAVQDPQLREGGNRYIDRMFIEATKLYHQQNQALESMRQKLDDYKNENNSLKDALARN